jgi:xanthosine utilization system XapX-like protein
VSTAMKEKEKVGDAVANDLQGAASQLHKIYEPQWNARADTLKTIVSLSSASIVLSVTFSSSLRALNMGLFWRYLIVFSFAMFVLSIVIALIGLWVGTQVYQIQSAMFNTRREVKQAFMDANSHEEFVSAFGTIQHRSLIPIVRSDKLTTWLFRTSSASFCVAIVSLAVVGARQLLS